MEHEQLNRTQFEAVLQGYHEYEKCDVLSQI